MEEHISVLLFNCVSDKGSSIGIRDGVIVSTCETSSLEFDIAIDCQGRVVTAGQICSHYHVYGKGAAAGGTQRDEFPDTLRDLWWKVDKALTPRVVKAAARLAFVEALLSGTTTVFDHHSSPNCCPGSLDWIEEAALHAGVRANLCYEVSDRDGTQLEGIQENVRFMKKPKSNWISSTFGLHACFTLSDETLKICSQYDGFHVHAGESTVDKGGVTRLNSFGMLGPKTILAHGVHVDEDEVEMIKSTGTFVVTNPFSNLNNRVGALRHQYEPSQFGLGTDGMTMSMLQERKMYQVVHHEPFDTRGNSILATRHFGYPIGTLEDGMAADIVVWDHYDQDSLVFATPPVWKVFTGGIQRFPAKLLPHATAEFNAAIELIKF